MSQRIGFRLAGGSALTGEPVDASADEPANWPLVVDLDGTLLKTNSLDETLLDALRHKPLALWRLPLELLAGRASAKAFLADLSPLQVETWPVQQGFLDYLREQAAAGRQIVLATAADRSVAEAIAAHFPFIGEVIASSPDCNMKGSAKAARLIERFPHGFIYAGDSAADLAVWREAAASIVVNAGDGVLRRAAGLGKPTASFPRSPLSPALLYHSLRLHQWVKNSLIFVPIVVGGKTGDASAWLHALWGFVALGFAASATYVINDLWDLPSDRRHWTKRLRPFASGNLSIRAGLLLAASGLGIGFGMAAAVGPAEVMILSFYVAASLSYTFIWKRIPILDVLVLASLFTFRLAFGIVLVDVRVSEWLLVFSMFLFMALSMAKRNTEVLRLAERGLDATPGRGYAPGDAPLTLGIGLASTQGAIIILILYLIEDAYPRGMYRNPSWLWVIPPTLFLFLGRVWLLSQRGQLHDDPVTFALKDRISLLLGLLMSLGFIAALIGVRWP
jgi:4-hydroxybenzoate polyprenyltransferase/phosphoserine phosphatase